jgi:undecaprenyl-diphosphatase
MVNLHESFQIPLNNPLELGSVIFGLQDSDNLLFAVAVHLATALSTVVVFRKEIQDLIRGLFKGIWNDSWRFTMNIIISMIPVAVVGILFEDEIESLFSGNAVLVGSMLMLTGLLLLFTFFRKEDGQEGISPLKAVIIGMAQTLAITPGISRSGATIATALLLNTRREAATRFSFLMVLIPIFGASLLKIKAFFETPVIEQKLGLMPLSLGFLAAFISGLIACRWMIAWVQKGKLYYFAIYCFVVGSLAIIFGLWL